MLISICKWVSDLFMRFAVMNAPTLITVICTVSVKKRHTFRHTDKFDSITPAVNIIGIEKLNKLDTVLTFG